MTFVIPYRNRALHLRQFMNHYKKLFPEAFFIIVEQADNKPFNRAKLLNIGFLKRRDDYYVFHDVDMLSIKADYSFPENPTHLATRCSQFKFKMPFPEYFGGVTLFNEKDFLTCNGFSNEFWGYGAEDMEMRENVLKHGLKIDSRDGVFNSLHHKRPVDKQLHRKNVELYKQGRGKEDGLKFCKYEVMERKEITQGQIIKVLL